MAVQRDRRVFIIFGARKLQAIYFAFGPGSRGNYMHSPAPWDQLSRFCVSTEQSRDPVRRLYLIVLTNIRRSFPASPGRRSRV